ncbi:MFS transporter [Achromobacter aegrifaciens]
MSAALPPAPPPLPGRLYALAVASLGAVIGSTFPLAAILALGDISGGLSASADSTAWLTTIYNVGQIFCLPIVMTSAAAFGRGRSMRWAGLGFVLASAAVALSPNLAWALTMRFAQGFFGGMLPVLMFVLIMGTLPPGRDQRRGLAAFAAATSVGVGLAGWLAAELVALGGWRMLFWGQAVLGAAYYLLARRALRQDRGDIHYLKVKDWPSYALLSASLSALVIAISEGERHFWFDTWWISACLLMGVVGMGLGAASLLKANRPLLHLDIFRKSTFNWAIVLQIIFRFGTLFAVWIAPQCLMRIHDFRLEQIAAMLLPLSLGTIVSLPVASWLVPRVDQRLVLSASLALFALACLLSGSLNPDWTGQNFTPALLVAGLGQGLFSVATLRFAVYGIGKTDGATCGIIFNYSRVLGLVSGIAVFSHVVNEREKYHSAMLNESVGWLATEASARLSQTAGGMANWVADPGGAQAVALGRLARSVARQAYTLSYGDAFLLAAGLLMLGAVVVWALPKLPSPLASPAPFLSSKTA